MAELSVEPGRAARDPGDATDVLDTPEAGARFLRGGVARLISYAATVALSVLSAALLTRHLRPAGFSAYTTVLSLVAVTAAITDAGMSTLGAREFAIREGVERERLMGDLLGLRVALTLIGVVLATIFAIAAGYDTALLLGTMIASLGTVALVVQHTYTIPMAAAMKLVTLSWLEVVRQVLFVGMIVALVLLGSGVLPLLAATALVNLLLIVPTARLAHHSIALRMARPSRRWSVLLKSTISFSLATAVGSLYVFTAQIVTSLVASPHQSGLFAASFRIFIVASAVPGLLVGGALPVLARAARDDRERLSYALERLFEVSLVLGVGAAVTMLGAAQFAIRVVAGPLYAGAAGPLRIQGLAIIASFVLAGWSFGLLSLKRHRQLLLANGIAFVLSCALTIALAASHGARGAALATLCGESVLALCLLVALVRGHPELRPPLGVVVKVLLAGAPAAAVALALPVSSLLRGLLALALYGVLVLIMRAVPAEVLALVPGRTSPRS